LFFFNYLLTDTFDFSSFPPETFKAVIDLLYRFADRNEIATLEPFGAIIELISSQTSCDAK
jgi:hypothetical protein